MIPENQTKNKTNDEVVAIAPDANRQGIAKGDDAPTDCSIAQNHLNPGGDIVDYYVFCDLEAQLEGVVFEVEEELDEQDRQLLEDCLTRNSQINTELPEQFLTELKKRTETQKTSPVKNVCLTHYDEFKASGISDEFIGSAFMSLPPEEVRGHLGWKGSKDQPGGWVALSVDPTDEKAPQQITRVKIDYNPEWLLKTEKEKAAKEGKQYKEPKRYRQKAGVPTTPIFLKVPKVGHCETWFEYLADPLNPVLITEGEKKAMLLLSLGIPCVVLAGVWNWQSEAGSKVLHPWLKSIAKGGRKIYLAFDADWISNVSVATALKEVSGLLEIEKANVSGIFWDGDKGKGIDDYLMNFPESDRRKELDRLINAAKPVKEQLTTNQVKSVGKQPKNPPFKGSHAANYLAEKYRSKLAWNTETNSFVQYGYKNNGVWSEVAPEAVKEVISSEMDNGSADLDGCPGHGHEDVTSVFNLMKGKLIRGEWQERSNTLPFENGVLDIETGQLLPHSPLNYFTWQIPRSHDPEAKEFPKINEWLDWVTNGDKQFKLLLLSWLNAVLVGRSDLHKFLNAYGTGRNGKGLFGDIAIALVGETNVHTSDLKTWGDNNFESSNVYGKKLIMMPDEDPCNKGVAAFKKLTGGDLLRNERKNKDAARNFVYKGMVMLASNRPVFQGDNSTAMLRRTILVHFDQTIPVEEQNGKLIKEFLPELSALTNHLLAMDDELVIETLKGLNASEPMKESAQAYQIRSNPLLAWVTDHLENVKGEEERVGNKNDGENHYLALYSHYCEYCAGAGNSPKSLQNFSVDLVDLLTNTLGWKGVKKRSSSQGKIERLRGQRGSFIENVRIKSFT